MKKKLLALFLVASMAVGILTGCGDTTTKTESTTKEESKTESKESVKAESKEEVKEEPVTVTWLVAQSEPKDLDMVLEDLNEKLVEKINVKLNLVCIEAGEYNDRTKLASTSNEEYDLVFTSSWRNNFDENMTRGALLDITDLIAEYGQDIVANVQPELWDTATVAGRIYAIPNQQTNATQQGYYIQKDLAEKYGWDKEHVEHASEIEPFLEEVLANEEGLFGVHLAQGPYQTGLESIALSCIYVRKDDDPSDGIEVLWYPEENNESDAFYADWNERGLLHPEYATGGDMNAVKAANKFVSWVGSAYPGGEVSVSNSQGKEHILTYIGTPYFSAAAGKDTMLGVNVNSKNPEAAVKLINAFWADETLFNELLFGLEGVHYNKVGDQRVEVIADSGWDLWKSDWAYGNQFIRWKVPGETDDCWDIIAERNRSCDISPVRGFNVDLSELQVEVSQINAVKAEYDKFYLRDDYSEEKIAERNQKMIDAGIETVVAEIQKQLDAWLVANGKMK